MNHIWQVTCRAGREMSRGLSLSLIKTWQLTRWASRGTGRGLAISLTKSWQFIRWASPRIGRGLWWCLLGMWMFLLWSIREFLILLYKMVSGPKRALTVFVILVSVLYLKDVVPHPTNNILIWAGIAAGLFDLVLFYRWVKTKLSPKTNLPVPVSFEPEVQNELPRPLLNFPRKRIYSDLVKARSLILLQETQSVSSVSQQMQIPKSTLYGWKGKYQNNNNFRSRIDTVIWLVALAKRSHHDSEGLIGTKHPR